MKKVLVCFAIVCLFVTSSFADEPDKKLHEQCFYPTVKLEISPDHGGGVGSGVIVRSVKRSENVYTNVVITSAHNLSKGPVSINVPKFKDWSEITGYDKFPCAVFAASQQHDIAVLFFESPTVLPVAQLDFDSKYFVGSEVFKFGYGTGDECRLDRGEITLMSTKTPFPNHLRINAHTIFGDSGGPCFLKSNYKVIGLVRAIRGFQTQFLTHITYITPMSFLKTWNQEMQNQLAFVIDSSVPIPMTLAELQKRNILLNYKAQLEATKKEIVAINQALENKKKMQESIEKEIQRIEEGRELPTPPMPNIEQPVAPPPP